MFSLTVSQNGHIIPSQNAKKPPQIAYDKAYEIFGTNIEIVRYKKRTNFRMEMPKKLNNAHHAEARTIQYMIDNNIPTKNARQAISHYSCPDCAYLQDEFEIINITGLKIDYGTISRKFLDNLY